MQGLSRIHPKFQSSMPTSSSGSWTPSPVLGKVFFCQAKAHFGDSGIGGSSNLKIVESIPNPPDEEKPVASLSPSLLDSTRLRAISRVSEIGPAGELRPQVLYLIELGMDIDQIKDITKRFPSFPSYSLEGKIKPLVEFLLDLGVLKSDIPTIFNKFPQLCGYSLSGKIIPSMAFLESLGMDKNRWAKLIYSVLSFPCCSRQKIKTTVDFLYEMGLSAESIGKILTRFPKIMGYSIEDKLRPSAEYFRSLGVDIAVLLRQAPQVLSLSIETNLKPVTEFFLERGYSTEQIRTMISRYGALYTVSLTKNLVPKWEFFSTMDYPQSDIIKFPAYFGYSLERRIKPWYVLMKACGVMLPLSSLLALSSDDLDKALHIKMKKKLAD